MDKMKDKAWGEAVSEKTGKRPSQKGDALRHEFYQAVTDVLQNAHRKTYRAVNFVMVEAYWNVGRMIVEEELQGKKRAGYGEALMCSLSERLTLDFGKGFSEPNLWNFRQFYLSFPILHALRRELRWTHYRLLMRVEKPEAREWYMNEAADQGWSTRALDRQINSLYYERLKMSRNKKPVIKEMQEKTALFPHKSHG